MDLRIWVPLAVVDQSILDKVKLVYIIGPGDRTAVLVTEEDEVLVCGPLEYKTHSSSMANCGQGIIPKQVEELRHVQVKGFASGCILHDDGVNRDTFVLAYTHTGKVYQWGVRIGVARADEVKLNFNAPQLVSLPTTISEVACGPDHCLVLSTNGEVFSWGNNSHGQLGNGTKVLSANPVKVQGNLIEKCVIKISCGYGFSVALLDNGHIFAWGDNSSGQLGSGSAGKPVLLPNHVSSITNVFIRDLVCGKSHVLAVSNTSKLYAWGKNDVGQLGLGDRQMRYTPSKHPIIRKIVDIAASYSASISVVLTLNNEVWMWGECAGFNVTVPLKTSYKSLLDVFAHYGCFRFTYKPIFREVTTSTIVSMSETIKKAFLDPETSDLTIRAEGKDILVHRAILRLRSDYFRLRLKDPWVEINQRVVEVHQSYDVIFSYLQFIYTGELNDDPELALELLILADEYQDLALKEYCERKVERCIQVDNVAILYPLALKLNAPTVKECCLSFASKCLSEVIKTAAFSEWDKDTMKEFIMECEKRKLFVT